MAVKKWLCQWTILKAQWKYKNCTTPILWENKLHRQGVAKYCRWTKSAEDRKFRQWRSSEGSRRQLKSMNISKKALRSTAQECSVKIEINQKHFKMTRLISSQTASRPEILPRSAWVRSVRRRHSSWGRGLIAPSRRVSVRWRRRILLGRSGHFLHSFPHSRRCG